MSQKKMKAVRKAIRSKVGSVPKYLYKQVKKDLKPMLKEVEVVVNDNTPMDAVKTA
jgi:hypothetical protein